MANKPKLKKGPQTWTLRQLENRREAYLNTLDDMGKDESYGTERGEAEPVLKNFFMWLEDNG